MSYPVISADSHVTEPPEAWRDIDPAFRDRAPRVQHIEGTGDIYVIEGLKVPIPLGIVAAAGKPPEEIRLMGTRFEDLHRGGWDPASRIAVCPTPSRRSRCGSQYLASQRLYASMHARL